MRLSIAMVNVISIRRGNVAMVPTPCVAEGGLQYIRLLVAILEGRGALLERLEGIGVGHRRLSEAVDDVIHGVDVCLQRLCAQYKVHGDPTS